MNSIQLHHKIKIQLDELSDLNDRFLSENREATAIDLELLKRQCVSLYETVLKLRAGGQTIQAVEEFTETEIPPASMEEFEIKEANIIGNQSGDVLVQPVNEVTEQEVHHEPVIAVKLESESEQDLFTEPVVEKKSNLINIPASELSIHAKISGNKQADINERINDSKVESLKAAIGLNKKIAFVNDLFKENTVEYAKAIDKLNSSIDLDEALRYFNELKHQYAWSNDHDLVIEFEQLIQKRFR